MIETALVFDLDGTLVDSKQDLALSVNAMRKHLGLETLPFDLIASYVGHGVTALMTRALGELERASERVPMDANPATAHMFIVNPLSGRSLMNLFSTHPPLEERIARLRSMRSY